jgi:hypothetical protein
MYENTGKDLQKSSKITHCPQETANENSTQNLYLKILMLLSLSQAFREDLTEGDACCPGQKPPEASMSQSNSPLMASQQKAALMAR